MAITAVVGRPGHGKSYSATEIAIVPALQEGRAVYTNIPLRDQAIARDFPSARVHYVELSVDQVNDPEFWQFAPGALVILDELWKVWPSGLRANKIPPYQLRSGTTFGDPGGGSGEQDRRPRFREFYMDVIRASENQGKWIKEKR